MHFTSQPQYTKVQKHLKGIYKSINIFEGFNTTRSETDK